MRFYHELRVEDLDILSTLALVIVAELIDLYGLKIEGGFVRYIVLILGINHFIFTW